jgi:hypothetical protein
MVLDVLSQTSQPFLVTLRTVNLIPVKALVTARFLFSGSRERLYPRYDRPPCRTSREYSRRFMLPSSEDQNTAA